ncbi:MAG: hypothetical protein JXA21_12950 [Anaerolineae bacterium]|nr:hypothetical protein [Anaerolineae bacterium]
MKTEQPAHNPTYDHMRLNEESITLLDTIRQRFPPSIPEKARLRLTDKMAMHGAGIARQRGDTTVTVDDILMGVHQFLWPEHLNLIRLTLGISPEKMEAYRQARLALDYVSVDDFLSNLKAVAKTCSVEIQEEKLLPALNCYKDPLEYETVYIKTTNRDLTPREFFIRPGNAAKWFDLAAMAKDHGLADFYDNPLYKAYLSICNEVGAVGSMVDISVDGEIKKFYAYFAHKAQPLGRIRKCENLPESILKNSAMLESLGLKRFAIFGVDFQHNSFNFYYHTDELRLDRAKLESIFKALDFRLPSEAMLKELESAATIYFTFTYTSDRIERLCFTRIYEDSMEKPVELVPELREFIEEAPIKTAKRNLLMGFTFDKKGCYLKVELDYRSSLYIPKHMKYGGLYCSLDEF